MRFLLFFPLLDSPFRLSTFIADVSSLSFSQWEITSGWLDSFSSDVLRSGESRFVAFFLFRSTSRDVVADFPFTSFLSIRLPSTPRSSRRETGTEPDATPTSRRRRCERREVTRPSWTPSRSSSQNTVRFIFPSVLSLPSRLSH